MNMSMSIHELVEVIQEIVIETVDVTKPMEALLGLVVSVEPLKISLTDNFVISAEAIKLVRNVTDFEVEVEVDLETEKAQSHSHNIRGKKMLKTYNGLKVGEKVLIYRWQGGKRYIVVDRIA